MSEIDDKDLVIYEDKKQIAEVLQQSNEIIKVQSEIISKIQKDLETYNRMVKDGGLIEIGKVAKVLNYKGIGRNNLYKLLRNERILRPDYSFGKYDNEPYQEYIDRGYFEVKVYNNFEVGNKLIPATKTYATVKGVDYIRKILDKMEYEYANR
jgi:phage antirepressor YoqD-like protein